MFGPGVPLEDGGTCTNEIDVRRAQDESIHEGIFITGGIAFEKVGDLPITDGVVKKRVECTKVLNEEWLTGQRERSLHQLVNVGFKKLLILVDEIIPPGGDEQDVLDEADGRLVLTEPILKKREKGRRCGEMINVVAVLGPKGQSRCQHRIDKPSCLQLGQSLDEQQRTGTPCLKGTR